MRTLVAAIILSSCIGVSFAEEPVGEPYLIELQQKAKDLKLWDDPHWHRLLHYRRSLLGVFGSEAASPGFFLAKTGRKSPRDELLASLAGLYSPEMLHGDYTHEPLQMAVCKFPARYDWLIRTLEIDRSRIPTRACPEFEHWMKKLDPQSVTMVFASAFMNSPGSMFGHTFLRIDRKGHEEGEHLMDHTLSFAAMINKVSPLGYVVKGLGGGFEGRYAALPYYSKVQEYTNMESRDLWEYRLNLSSTALHRLVLHSWEMGSTQFPYYFVNKNCSYQLLPLLEVAEPKLKISPKRPVFVIPVDTLRWVAEFPGLVDDVVYRPSQASKLFARKALLNKKEKKIVAALGFGDLNQGLADAATLPADRQALIFDAAADYLLFITGPVQNPSEGIRKREAAVLSHRGKIDSPATPPPTAPKSAHPHLGHRSSRVGISGGSTDESTFEEISARIAMHDLLDPPQAYIPGSKLEGPHLKFRRVNKSDRIYLHEAKLLEITSISPWDSWTKPNSWTVQLGYSTDPGSDQRDWASGYWDFRWGAGLAARSSVVRQETFYALGQVLQGVSPVFRKGYRLGTGAKLGALLELHPRYRAQAEGEIQVYTAGDTRPDYGIKLIQNFDVTTNLILRLSTQSRRRSREISLMLGFFL